MSASVAHHAWPASPRGCSYRAQTCSHCKSLLSVSTNVVNERPRFLCPRNGSYSTSSQASSSLFLKQWPARPTLYLASYLLGYSCNETAHIVFAVQKCFHIYSPLPFIFFLELRPCIQRPLQLGRRCRSR